MNWIRKIATYSLLSVFLLVLVGCPKKEDNPKVNPKPQENQQAKIENNEILKDRLVESTNKSMPSGPKDLNGKDDVKPAPNVELQTTDADPVKEIHWYTDFEAALKKAVIEKKNVVLNFSGSDWCYWCKQLDKKVFSRESFVKEASKHFVFVLVDFPYDRSNQSKKVQKQNAFLDQYYGIRTQVPAIVVADAKGRPYGRTGYYAEIIDQGPGAFLSHLIEITRQPVSK